MQIRLTGEGDAGERGGPRGDLFVLLHVKPDPVFRRDSNDLHCDVHINVAEAALGCSVKVPTLEGEETLSIRAGTQAGQRLKLRGMGVPEVRGSRRGDLYAHVIVDIPRKLTREQRRIFEDLLPVAR